MLFIFLGGIELTANVANLTIFLVFLAVNLSVIQFARKKIHMGRGYVLSAAVGAITSAAMLTQFSWEVVLLSTLLTVAGAGVFLLTDKY